jgi:hypothetical protein
MAIIYVLKKIGEINQVLLENHTKLTQNQMHRLGEELNRLLDRIKSSSIPSQKKDVDPNKLYSAQEAADILEVSTKTISRMVKDGLIKNRGKGGKLVFYYRDFVNDHHTKEPLID